MKFPTFLAAVQFVSEMAPAAERLDHHPDITLSWRNVGIALSTHSAGGLTALDFELARHEPERMEETAEQHFGLPQPSLDYWYESTAQRPWRDHR